MKRKIGQVLAFALTVLMTGSGLAQDAVTEAQEQEGQAGMEGMQMAPGMMQGGMGQHHGMMQMMMHCMSMMEQMHGESVHEHEGTGGMNGMGGMGGMNGMGMSGRMEGDQSASGFDVTTAEALARAFIHGQGGDDTAPVEIVGVTVEDGRFLVEYRRGNAQGTVAVDAETGEVTEADDR